MSDAGPPFGAVVYAKNLQRLSDFYAQVIGLAVQQAAQDHVVLGAAGFELVIHAIPARIAATIEISSPPERRSETPIKLCFRVASLSAARAAAQRLGGQIVTDEQGWTFRGVQVCDGLDPEGNVFQVRQALAAP
jgi:predicted enzyme related to lactoylglutathione lyase